jgi:tetratricopeptide (TPR) repeat protein
LESKTQRELLAQWLLASGCFAVLVFFFSPPFGAFRLWSRVPEMQGMLEVRRGVSVLAQVAHPGVAIADPLHAAIRWRLFFPILGHLLQLPPPMLLGLAPLGCLAVLAFIISVLRRAGGGWFEAGLAVTILGATSWFFTSVSWLGYFDSWLVLALLVTAFARTRWSVWLACLWAPWVDERFIVAAPLALLCRHVYLSQAKAAPAAGASPGEKRELAVAATLLGAFAVVRLGLLAGPANSGTSVAGYFASFNLSGVAWSRILFGAWSGLRVAWVFVAAAAWLCWQSRRDGFWMAAAILATIAVGLGTAQDLSRSTMLVLPAALLGAVLALTTATGWRPWALPGLAAAALVLPAHHVMSDRVNPIFYLYHELAALDNPPPAAMPELQILRGILDEEQGNAAGAEADFTLAIRLGGPAAGVALKQRGVLLANQRRWPEARRDFSAMTGQDPGDPDGWFLRSQANLALGDSAGARADLQQALAAGSPEWLHRPDVARYVERMNRPAGSP